MTRLSIQHLVKWAFYAIISAILSIVLVSSFKWLIFEGFPLTQEVTGQFVFLVPLLGVVICSLIIYRISPKSAREGLHSYIYAVNIENGYFSLGSTLCKYFAALATLITGGSGGIVGPLGRVSAGIISNTIGILPDSSFKEEDRRIAAICGVSAIFAVTFHTPIAGGLFAVEVLKRAKMGYLDLFPSIMSSCFAVALCKVWNISPFYSIYAHDDFMVLSAITWIPLIGVITGLAGMLYTKFYVSVREYMQRDKLRIQYMVFAAIFVGISAFFIHKDLMGTSSNLFTNISRGIYPNIFSSDSGFAIALSLLILAFFKATTNCITVGSGMSAGFVGPVFLVGLLIAASMASLLQIPVQSATYYAFLAAGMSGFLSACLNVPLAAAVMGVEVFGSEYSFPAATASIIAFQIARGETICGYQFESIDRLENSKELNQDREPLAKVS